MRIEDLQNRATLTLYRIMVLFAACSALLLVVARVVVSGSTVNLAAEGGEGRDEAAPPGSSGTIYISYDQYNYAAERSRNAGHPRHTPIDARVECWLELDATGSMTELRTRRTDLSTNEPLEEITWSGGQGRVERVDLRTGARSSEPVARRTLEQVVLGTVGYVDMNGLERHFDRRDDGSYDRHFDGPLWEEVHNAHGPLRDRRIEMTNQLKGERVWMRRNFVFRHESATQGGA